MFKFFKKNQKEPENLKEILASLKRTEKDYQEVNRQLAELKEANKKNLQKLGIVRFNPFKESGGDQSFSIALLDANNNGFVITSLYGRETSRVYAKPVEKGQSKHQLSQEEIEAINQAIHG